MNVTNEPRKHVKMPDEPLEIDEKDFYVRAFIKWAIEEQPVTKRLEAENAKLRELVRIMHGELVSCEDNGYVCGGHKFDERVRELGIEVDGCE